jgi:uncharacterized protein (DUF1786 family)
MSQYEEEFTDVVVVMVDRPGMTMEDAIERLKAVGLEIAENDPDNDVVEGTIHKSKLGKIKELEFVKYVRSVFEYYAEKEEAESDSEDLDDVDDARR